MYICHECLKKAITLRLKSSVQFYPIEALLSAIDVSKLKYYWYLAVWQYCTDKKKNAIKLHFPENLFKRK